MKIIIAFLLGFLLTLASLPLFLKMFQEVGASGPNYRGESIPVGIGLIFIFVYMPTSFLLTFFMVGEVGIVVLFLLGIVYFAILGLLDDLLGSRDTSGLKGHFSALFKGRLTTGALKALGGGLGALLISYISLPGQPWWEIFTAALLIALAANSINLVDLRPGRAVKIFSFWFIALLIAFSQELPMVLLAPLAGGVLAYAPLDLRARAMLGDTGSNLLGAALGMASVWMLSFSAQLTMVTFLFLLHLFTEEYSLTEIIEKNPWLRFLDNLGRS